MSIRKEIIGILSNHSTQISEIQDTSKEAIDYINKVNQFYTNQVLLEFEKRLDMLLGGNCDETRHMIYLFKREINEP